MKKRDVLGFGLAITMVLASGLPSLPVRAQGKYPERAIRLVIPFAPGGNTDIMGRLFGAKIAPLLGQQQVVIDNKAGANGVIGSVEVARAKPDGYTLLVCTSGTHAINPSTMKNLPYDPVKDFAPIAVLGITPMVIAVHPSVASSLQELVKRVRANPGKYSYGSPGLGGTSHLAMELFKMKTGGLDIVHVPYRGAGPSIQDLIAGQIPIANGTFSAALQYHRSGKARILTVLSEKRSHVAPDVPTVMEAVGVPGLEAYTFNILCAPAGTPRPIIDQLYHATMKVTGSEAFQKDLERLTVEPVTDSNPESAAQLVKNEIAKWAPVVKAAGLAQAN